MKNRVDPKVSSMHTLDMTHADEVSSSNQEYRLVARAINQIVASNLEGLSPAVLAQQLGVSGLKLRRLFNSWAGISPSRFIQFVSYLQAADGLRVGKKVFAAAMDGGVSSASRLYDCTGNIVAMTPGELAEYVHYVSIWWGLSETPFGQAVVAWTQRGICSLQFVDDDYSVTQALQRIQREWTLAALSEDQSEAKQILSKVFSTKSTNRVALDVRGTNFQVQVWKALLEIPFGDTAAYQQLAENVGRPKAQRAVGTAVGANPVSILIPCHRVIRSTGVIGKYRWGATRKRALLVREALTA